MTGIKQASSSDSEATPVSAPAGSSKIAAVLVLLETDQGATLASIVAATAWQPHTARAMLSGLKKKSHNVVREKVDDISRYRIIKGAAR